MPVNRSCVRAPASVAPSSYLNGVNLTADDDHPRSPICRASASLLINGASLVGWGSSRNDSGRGERNVGLGVDTVNPTGAFRIYERAGMAPVVGWDLYEKEIGRRRSGYGQPERGLPRPKQHAVGPEPPAEPSRTTCDHPVPDRVQRTVGASYQRVGVIGSRVRAKSAPGLHRVPSKLDPVLSPCLCRY